ncbi:nitrile hydratase accessory protein, partial [Martelella alba]
MSSLMMSAIPHVAAEEPEMVFGEPWQAEAFATALQLSRNGAYSWSEWVQTFSGIIRSQPQRAEESAGEAYYRQWLAALEALLREKALLSGEDVDERQALWYLAYLNTPHVILTRYIQTAFISKLVLSVGSGIPS